MINQNNSDNLNEINALHFQLTFHFFVCSRIIFCLLLVCFKCALCVCVFYGLENSTNKCLISKVSRFLLFCFLFFWCEGGNQEAKPNRKKILQFRGEICRWWISYHFHFVWCFFRYENQKNEYRICSNVTLLFCYFLVLLFFC